MVRNVHDPTILQIGPMKIYGLEVVWVVGALMAVWLLQLQLKRCGHDRQPGAAMVISTAIAGGDRSASVTGHARDSG